MLICHYFKTKDMSLPSYLENLKTFVPIEILQDISLDNIWSDLVDRTSEFAVLMKPEFTIFLVSVAGVCKYYYGIEHKKIEVNRATPRIFRNYLHKVIESVRLMRAALEDKSMSSLNDFDELAAEIQRTHDDYATNIFYDANI